MGYKIAIDGPSGTGKGYVAHEVSKKLGIIYIDTGAMYRAFALYCKKNNVNLDDKNEIEEALKNTKIYFSYNKDIVKIFLNEQDVSSEIRTEEIGMLAAKVSAIPSVRNDMVQRQRKIAGNNYVIMEGRDIGNVVLPDAELKIFLTASLEVRTQRRYKELYSNNKTVTYEQVLKDIKRRDEADLTKVISPLLKAQDMIEIDTTSLSKEQVVEEVLKLVKQKGLIKID